MSMARIAWFPLCLAVLMGHPHLLGQATEPPVRGDIADLAAQLLSVKRICVSAFAGDQAVVDLAREIAFSALFSGKRFRITENCENADAVLKGAVVERSEVRARGESEGVEFGRVLGGATVSGDSGSAAIGGVRGANNEALYSSESRSQATVTLRLVGKEGDVILAFTQESPQGKTKSAVADAVDRAVRQLFKEVEKAEKAAVQ
jgi:hypothetical protein